MNLFNIKFLITTNCNFKCPYCCTYAPYLNNKDVSIEYIRYLVDSVNINLKDYTILYEILGGEPFLNKDFVNLIKILFDTKKIFKFRIYSNNSLDIRPILDELKDYHYKFEFQLTRHINDLYNETIFINNLDYLIHHNITTFINFLDRLDEDINSEYNTKVTNLKKKYSEYNKKLQIKSYPIAPTKYFNIKNFDFDWCNNYNSRVKLVKENIKNYIPVYPYRSITIDSSNSYYYNCHILKDERYKLSYLLNISDFDKIINNMNKTILCKCTNCDCVTCYTKDEIES